jgi:hypothetical protein
MRGIKSSWLSFVATALAACGGAVSSGAGSGIGTGSGTSGTATGSISGSSDGRDAGPDDGGGGGGQLDGSDDAMSAGSLPACTWPAPPQPDAGLVVVAAERTALFCGMGNINNMSCLSTSATECTPLPIYGYASCDAFPGPYCSPCGMICAPNEYAIGVATPQSAEGFPESELQYPALPSECHTPDTYPSLGFVLAKQGPGYEWSFSCCPCQ